MAKIKVLKNHKLINYLADQKDINMVSATKDVVIATFNDKFRTENMKYIIAACGQIPRCTKQDGLDVAIFRRYPQDLQ